MNGAVVYNWKGYLERKKYRQSAEKTVYLDTRFERRGYPTNPEADAIMEQIIQVITQNSGLITRKV